MWIIFFVGVIISCCFVKCVCGFEKVVEIELNFVLVGFLVVEIILFVNNDILFLKKFIGFYKM